MSKSLLAVCLTGRAQTNLRMSRSVSTIASKRSPVVPAATAKWLLGAAADRTNNPASGCTGDESNSHAQLSFRRLQQSFSLPVLGQWLAPHGQSPKYAVPD